MKWRAWTLFAALLVCSFCACPNSRQTYTIQSIKLSFTIGTIGPVGEAITEGQPFETEMTVYMTMANGEITNNLQFADLNIVADQSSAYALHET